MKGNLIKKSISMMLAFAMSSSLVCVSKAAEVADIPTTPHEIDEILPISNVVYLDKDSQTTYYGMANSPSIRASKGVFIELDINDLIPRAEEIDNVKLNVYVSTANDTPVYVQNVTDAYPEIVKEYQEVSGIDENWSNIKTTYDNKAKDQNEDGSFEDELIAAGAIKTDFASTTGMREVDITDFVKKNIEEEKGSFLLYFNTHTSASPALNITCNPFSYTDARQTYLTVAYKDISDKVLAELNAAADVDAYAAVLEQYADAIGIDYDLLHSTACLSDMLDADYTAYAQIQEAFNAAVASDLKAEEVKFDHVMNFNTDSTVTDCINSSGAIWIQAGRDRAVFLQKDLSSYKGNADFIKKVYASFYFSSAAADNVVIRGLDYDTEVDTYAEYKASYFAAFNNTIVAMTNKADVIGTNKKVTVDITDYVKSKILAGEWINLSVRNYSQNVASAIYGGGHTTYAPALTVVYDQTAMDEYNDSVVLNSINTAENGEALKTVVNNNYATIGVDNAALANMDVVYNALAGKAYSSLQDFKQDFEAETAKYIVEKEIDMFNYGLYQIDQSKFSMRQYGTMVSGTTDRRYAIINYKPTDLEDKNIKKATLKIAPYTISDESDINSVTIKYNSAAYSEALDALQTDANGNAKEVKMQGFDATTASNATITAEGNEMRDIFNGSASNTVTNPGGKVTKWASDAVFEYVDLDVTDALQAAKTANTGNLTMFVSVSPNAMLMFDARYKQDVDSDGDGKIETTFHSNGVPVKLMVYYDISEEIGTALAAMNDATTVDAVATALTEYSLAYETDLTGMFAALTDEQKAVIYNALLNGKTYKYLSEIKNVFDTKLAAIVATLDYFTITEMTGCNELVYENGTEGTNGQFYIGSISVRKNKEYNGDVIVMAATYRDGKLENVGRVKDEKVSALKSAAVGETVKLGQGFSFAPKCPSEIKIFVWDSTSGLKAIAKSQSYDPADFITYSEGVVTDYPSNN